MGLFDRVRLRFGNKTEEIEKANNAFWKPFERPAESHMLMGVTDVSKIPMFPFSFRLFYDMYYYCDVLRTVLRALIWEIFRNGIEVKEKFVSKCVRCGTEYEKIVDVCENCGSNDIRQPDPDERRMLENLITVCNLSNEGLIDVFKDLATDIAVTDNGFLVVVKKYSFDEKGKVVGAKVIEILRGSPNKIRLVMSKDGKMGYLDDGRMVFTCLEHRDQMELVRPEEFSGEVRCKVCNKVMYPAWYEMIGGAMQTKRVFYIPGEVLHVKLFTTGIGYGISPLVSIMVKVLILIKMDWFILMAYHLQRPPKGLLVLRGQRDSIAKAWDWLMEKARINPHMIYPLVVEGQDTGKRVAEWIDLSIKASDIDFIAYRDEVRKAIGAVYGVLPLWMGDTGGGLANEGLQVIVSNRTVEMWQRLFNDKIIPWLMDQLGMVDYRLMLRPHELRDEMTQLELNAKKLQLANALRSMGYDVTVKKRGEEFDIDFEEVDILDKLADMIEKVARAEGKRVNVNEIIENILLMIRGIDEKDENKIGELVGDIIENKVESEGKGEEVIGVVGEGGKIEQTVEGEGERGRVKRTEQRFEGEPFIPRR